MRLDRALPERGLARSRSHATELIRAGSVRVGGAAVTKPAFEVSEASRIVVDAPAGYVSRAAFKLAGALDACEPLALDVTGAHALDAGASTGGFTQVLLERGVAHVHAVDVGHGQIAPAIASDPRVTVREGVSVRELTAADDGAGCDLVVADLSFISLQLVVPAFVDFAAPGAQMLLMVKPQFEVGRERLGNGGVVTDPALRIEAVSGVIEACVRAGLHVRHVERSSLPGPHGNVEFFVWVGGPWQARTDMDADPGWPTLDEDEAREAVVREVLSSDDVGRNS